MVHLTAVGQPDEAQKLAALRLTECIDNYTTTVYGSKYAQEHLPKHTMPEHEMPREVAYRMIKDELSLDGNPKLK